MARKGSKDRGVIFKDGKWWVRLYVNAREKWHCCDNKSQAKTLYGRLKAEIREGTYFPEKFAPKTDITLRAWIDRCLEGSTNRGIDDVPPQVRVFNLCKGTKNLFLCDC